MLQQQFISFSKLKSLQFFQINIRTKISKDLVWLFLIWLIAIWVIIGFSTALKFILRYLINPYDRLKNNEIITMQTYIPYM